MCWDFEELEEIIESAETEASYTDVPEPWRDACLGLARAARKVCSFSLKDMIDSSVPEAPRRAATFKRWEEYEKRRQQCS